MKPISEEEEKGGICATMTNIDLHYQGANVYVKRHTHGDGFQDGHAVKKNVR